MNLLFLTVEDESDTFIFICVESPFVRAAQAAAPEYACIKTESSSYPVQVTSTSEKKLNIAKTRAEARKQIKRAKSKTRALKYKRKTLKKSKQGKSAARKTRIDKKIAKINTQLDLQPSILVASKNLLKLLAQCKGGKFSDLYPQILDVESFSLPVGQSMTAKRGITIRAEKSIEVAGSLLSDPDKGGSLTLYSKSGDVKITAGATVAAGNGDSGASAVKRKDSLTADNTGALRVAAVKDISSGGGTDGGDVILRAPNGTITVEDGVTIHIGNGGSGADITLKNTDALSTGAKIQLKNGGGVSGGLGLEAQNIVGLDVEKIVVDGQPGWLIKSDKNLSGGKGGAAGNLTVLKESSAHRTSALRERIVGRHYSRAGIEIAKAELHVAWVGGVSGGDSCLSPTPGATVNITGKNGQSPGDNGQSAEALGGKGGKGVKSTLSCIKNNVKKIYL